MKDRQSILPPIVARNASIAFLTLLATTGTIELANRLTSPPGNADTGSWGMDHIMNASSERQISNADLAGVIDAQVAYISKYRKLIPTANIKMLSIPYDFVNLLDSENRTFSRGSVASTLREAAARDHFAVWFSMSTNLTPLRLSAEEQMMMLNQFGMKLSGNIACRLDRDIFVSTHLQPLVLKWEKIEVYYTQDGKARWLGKPVGYTLKNLNTGHVSREWANGLYFHDTEPTAFKLLRERCDPAYAKAK